MAKYQVKAESVVTLNARGVDATINALNKEIKHLQQAIKECQDETKKSKLQKNLDDSRQALQKLHKDTKDFSQILNNINGASLKELNRLARSLKNELQSLAPNTKEFVEKSKQLQQVISRNRGRPNKELADLANQLNQIMEKWKL